MTNKKYFDQIEVNRRRNNLMRLYLGVGLLFIVGFYFINDSETVNNYLRLASGDPSGFRFLLFIGILKYGTLVTGLTLLAATSIYFALQLYKK